MARHMRHDDTDPCQSHDVRTVFDDETVQLIIGAVIFTVFVIIPLVMLAIAGGIDREETYVPAHYEYVLPRD